MNPEDIRWLFIRITSFQDNSIYKPGLMGPTELNAVKSLGGGLEFGDQ